MAVYQVGDDRIAVLAAVDISPDPAWIEAAIAEQADAWQSAMRLRRSDAGQRSRGQHGAGKRILGHERAFAWLSG